METIIVKEQFNDEAYYSEGQDFGSIEVKNYAKVIRNYNYLRYVHRFQQMADARRLPPELRPKLTADEFAAAFRKLTTSLASCGEANLLKDQRNQKIADRLLITGLFDFDFCMMDPNNWVRDRTGNC